MNICEAVLVKYQPPQWGAWEVDIGNEYPEYVNFPVTEHQSPANRRYRQRVAQNVTWREILALLEFGFTPRRRNHRYGYDTAAVRSDSRLGEVFYVRCRFHDEQTASLCMLPWGFHCFGCGQTGDKIDFVAGCLGLRSAQSIKRFFTDSFSGMTPRASHAQA